MLQIKLNEKHYRIFIKYAMATCSSFSLVFEKDETDKIRYVFEDIYYTIKDFVLGKKSIGYHPDTGTFFQNSDIIYCECNKYTESVLLKATTMLDWDGIRLPEELCFYRNGEKWFTFVCHERYLFVYNETQEDILFLKKEGIGYRYEV